MSMYGGKGAYEYVHIFTRPLADLLHAIKARLEVPGDSKLEKQN